MIVATSFSGQKVAVFGLQRSGISAALSLQAGGADVFAWDDGQASRQQAQAEGVNLVDLSTCDWTGFQALVLSPGIADSLPAPHWAAQKAQAAQVPIICDIEIFAREVAARQPHARPKIIAITGTNGKSTTTALMGHVLEACGRDVHVGGNIGRAVLDLGEMHGGAYYVLELSSFQLERTFSLRADVALLLNVTPDHLDRHGHMEAYIQAKLRIFDNQQVDDTIIVGIDCALTQQICTRLMSQNGRFIYPVSARASLSRGIFVLNGQLYNAMDRYVHEVMDLRQVPSLPGRHNWQNAAAAYGALVAIGLSETMFANAFLTFPGLAHRMEKLGKVGTICYVNDSKATNIQAALQAITVYDNIYWIAGGQSKEDTWEELQAGFQHITKAYLIGEIAPQLKKNLQTYAIDCKISGTLELAVLCATRDALASDRPNPVILLSPACTSFDQFAHFEQRGDMFKAYVYQIMDLFEREKKRAENIAAVQRITAKKPDFNHKKLQERRA